MIRWGILSTARIGTVKVIPAMQRGQYCEVLAIDAGRSLSYTWDHDNDDPLYALKSVVRPLEPSPRIATLADTVDLVGLTDNHAGQPRMSPLAAVALAREEGVGTIDQDRFAGLRTILGTMPTSIPITSAESGRATGSRSTEKHTCQ